MELHGPHPHAGRAIVSAETGQYLDVTSRCYSPPDRIKGPSPMSLRPTIGGARKTMEVRQNPDVIPPLSAAERRRDEAYHPGKKSSHALSVE